MPKKIKVNIFEELKEALQDVAAYERGEPINLRVTRIPSRPKPLSPKEVRHIRRSLKASQALFATYLNVSANAVRSWEQGTRRPPQPDVELLTTAKKDPKATLVAYAPAIRTSGLPSDQSPMRAAPAQMPPAPPLESTTSSRQQKESGFARCLPPIAPAICSK